MFGNRISASTEKQPTWGPAYSGRCPGGSVAAMSGPEEARQHKHQKHARYERPSAPSANVPHL